MSILASIAVECMRDFGVGAADAAPRDVAADERRVMWTAYEALCVRVDPCSRRLDDQLERLAALIAAQSLDATS